LRAGDVQTPMIFAIEPSLSGGRNGRNVVGLSGCKHDAYRRPQSATY
jgi:hypothetical protein